MLENLGIAAELAARREKYARFAYVAPHDRLPRDKPAMIEPPVEAEIVVSRRIPVPRQVLAVMRKFCKVYSEVSGTEYTVEMLKCTERTRALAWPRHVCMYLATKITGVTTTPLGRAFGGRDHTSVTYALQNAPSHMLTERHLLTAHDAVMAFFSESK
jgi:hypothetical protein